jgi:SAM-dependent methyltransferase
VDPGKPNAARIYDYFLGGYHNFEIDRAFAEQVLLITPHLRLTAQINRAFLRRVIRYVVGQGIGQILDIGSGIPTVGNVHEIAQGANPATRVVYADIDPVAVAHSKAILAGNANAAAIRGDVRAPEEILSHSDVTRLLDFSQPVAIVMAALLHWVPDDAQAYAVVRRLRDAVVPGSYLVIAHGVPDTQPQELAERLNKAVDKVTVAKNRTPAEILPFFEGTELVEPGLVLTPLWRPEGPDDVGLDKPEIALCMAGVGRKL